MIEIVNLVTAITSTFIAAVALKWAWDQRLTTAWHTVTSQTPAWDGGDEMQWRIDMEITKMGGSTVHHLSVSSPLGDHYFATFDDSQDVLHLNGFVNDANLEEWVVLHWRTKPAWRLEAARWHLNGRGYQAYKRRWYWPWSRRWTSRTKRNTEMPKSFWKDMNVPWA